VRPVLFHQAIGSVTFAQDYKPWYLFFIVLFFREGSGFRCVPFYLFQQHYVFSFESMTCIVNPWTIVL
jgi:hypothetical protein